MDIFSIVPIPLVKITVLDNETLGNETLGNVTIGDPLTLDCTVTAVRGISSSVDIIWTTEGRVVRRVDNITADIVNDSAIYTDSFEISSLSTIDNRREYQCTVVINATQPVNSSDQFTLIFPGKHIHIPSYYSSTQFVPYSAKFWWWKIFADYIPAKIFPAKLLNVTMCTIRDKPVVLDSPKFCSPITYLATNCQKLTQ